MNNEFAFTDEISLLRTYLNYLSVVVILNLFLNFILNIETFGWIREYFSFKLIFKFYGKTSKLFDRLSEGVAIYFNFKFIF